MQHALPSTQTPGPRSFTPVLPSPPPQLIAPPAADQNAADHVDEADAERQEASPRLHDGQQDGLDVEFEKDAGDGLFGDGVALGGDGVLVREDGVGGGERAVGRAVQGNEGGEGAGVDGGDDGEVVLEFVEVVGRCGEGVVERIE